MIETNSIRSLKSIYIFIINVFTKFHITWPESAFSILIGTTWEVKWNTVFIVWKKWQGYDLQNLLPPLPYKVPNMSTKAYWLFFWKFLQVVGIFWHQNLQGVFVVHQQKMIISPGVWVIWWRKFFEIKSRSTVDGSAILFSSRTTILQRRVSVFHCSIWEIRRPYIHSL